MVKTILYDFDGTIGNTNQLIYDSFVHTFSHFNIKYTDRDIYQAFGPTLYQTFSKYADNEDLISEMINVYREFNLYHHDEYVKAFPYVQETIALLDSLGYKQGVVSSKKTDLVYQGLEITGLLSYMKCVVGGDDVSKHKPDPEGVFKALSLLGEDTAYVVGDNPGDIISGRNAGCKTIGVSWSVKKEELNNANPDYMINDFRDILEIVR